MNFEGGNELKRLLMVGLAALFITGCSADNNKAEKENEEVGKKNQAEEVAHNHQHAEPDAHTECEFCNMKVYMESEEMGEFTAQAITEDGKNLFFDDAGCLVNFENENEDVKIKERLVRDFDSKEWITFEDAKIAHADIKTPMNYGNAFFKSDEGLQKFLSTATAGEESSIDAIKTTAFERAAKKKMNGGHGGHDSHDDHDEHDEHGDEEDDHSGH